MKRLSCLIFVFVAVLFCGFASGDEFTGAKHRRSKRIAIASLLFGEVRIVQNRKNADFCVYEVSENSQADLNVFKTLKRLDAHSCGLWWMTKAFGPAVHDVYITQNESEADINIRYVKSSGRAGFGGRVKRR